MARPRVSIRATAERLLREENPRGALRALTAGDADLDGDDQYFAARLSVMCGNAEDALDWLDQARGSFEQSGEPLLALRTELGRVNVLHDLGRNSQSVAIAEQLRADLAGVLSNELSPQDQQLHSLLSASAAVNLGAMLGVVGRHSAAAVVLAEASALYADSDSPDQRVLVQANLGLELLNTGRGEEAEAALAAVRSQFAELDDQWLVYRALVYQSQAVASTGRYGSALALLEEADAVIGESDMMESTDALRSRLARAQVLVALNLFPEVLQHCRELLPVLAERSMVHDLAQCRLLEAMALLGLRRPSDAQVSSADSVSLFLEADLAVRSAHARITLARCLEPEAGCVQIDTSIEVLNEAGESRRVAEAALAGADLAPDLPSLMRYLSLADSAGALEVPELAWRTLWHRSNTEQDPQKCRALLDQALAAQRTIRSDLATDDLRLPFLLNRRQPLESRVRLHLRDGETDEAFALSAAYRAWTLNPTASPERTESGTATSTTLLYQAIGNRLICFVSTPSTAAGHDQITAVDLGPVLDDVAEQMIKLEAEWRHLADPRLRVHVDALRGVVERILQRLYLAVFAKVEGHIAQGSPVTIVPTGRIAALPFAALHDGFGYLDERLIISLSPGVPRHDSTGTARRGRTVVVGVPDKRAPNVEREVEQIHEITNGDMLLGPSATAESARQATTGAAVVHLAGHSTFRPENPWLSSFRFADRDVTAAELAGWDLHSATVILASCSSGRQSNLGEDELLGLPRALLRAGATNVVVNLWTVDDVASVGMMSHLHQKLLHVPLAAALRSAQNATRDLHGHPYFWAAPLHYLHPAPPTRVDTAD